MRRPGVALAVALAVLAGPAAPQDLTLPRDEARGLAVEALLAGDADLARALAAGLIAADPGDRVALLVLAKALPELGRPDEGRQAGATAWRLSANPDQRYEAARLTALAAAAGGDYWLAGLWLRLALTAAPDEAEAAATRADAADLRRLQRWQTTLSFGLAPSDNVNGGTSSRDYVINGIPTNYALSADSLALSGWVATASIGATYRLRESSTRRTRLAFRLGGRGVILSDEAKATLDADDNDATAADFSTAYAEIGLNHDLAFRGGLLSVSADLGRRWPGDEDIYNFGRLSFGYARRTSEQVALGFGAWHEWRNLPRLTSLERVWGTRLGITYAWSGGDTTVQFFYGETESENRNARNRDTGLFVSHAFAEPVGPAFVTLSAGYDVTRFPDYATLFIIVPGGRRDERVSASVEAALPGFGWAGFEPVVRLDAARTDSNVSRFETETLGLGFEIRSAF